MDNQDNTLTTEVTIPVKVQFYINKNNIVSVANVEVPTVAKIMDSIDLVHFKDLKQSKYCSVGVIHPLGAISSYYLYQKI